MTVAAAVAPQRERGLFSRAWNWLGALPAGMLAGGVVGAVVGGVVGRLLMRMIFLADESRKGVRTDFGTVGEIALGGSFSLLMLSTVAGIIGGMIYVGLRRWLPERALLRAVFFGLLVAFGGGFIAISEIDMQIFEPAVPLYLSFIALIVLYGAGVSWLVDRLHPMQAVRAGARGERVRRGVLALVALGICAIAILATQNVHANGGTCLSGDGKGGCAARPPGNAN